MSHLPLKGLTVLEFSQYLSGPSAGLRLADLGARVIKIERPKVGDACRQLAIKDLWADDGSSLLFHTINRNKESFSADLKKSRVGWRFQTWFCERPSFFLLHCQVKSQCLRPR